MTQFSRSWRRRGALITIATAGALTVGLSAAPAFAHTPTWSVTCDEVSLDLTRYGYSDQNTVTVTVDGKDLLPTENFRNNFKKTLDLPEHNTELTVRLILKAADGERFSKDETKTAPVCEGTPPPAEETTPPPAEETTPPPAEETTPPAEETTPPAEETTPPTSGESTPPAEETTPPAPKDDESTEPPAPSDQPSSPGDLAETGSSSATPMIAGAAAVVLVAGAGIMWAARKRRSVQN
ncbi:LAETG motif-containing sortase-dependent surface protein [Streptomyces sp. NPDC087850]|uniref:LAETG motif-containing sortase-dependent surface protein n=1 Tax=Streptomyces sp. NPDC087850 TaxID=3365809 RepID=UPI0037F8BAE4